MSLRTVPAFTVTSDGCAPCQQRREEAAVGHQSEHFRADPGVRVPWAGCIGEEEVLTGDGRLIELNALRWERLPLPLRYVDSDVGAHDGAVVVGRITKVWRSEAGRIMASGDIDTSTPEGAKAAKAVDDESQNGVSMDLDDVSFEIRVAADVIARMEEMMQGDGPLESESGDPDADGRVTVAEISSDDEVNVTTSGRVRAATLVAIPAFDNARIALTADSSPSENDPPAESLGDESLGDADADSLAASAYPVEPPAAWFADPKFDSVQPLRVTKDGRVYGHLAQWGQCHVAHSHRSCITAPHSASGYAYFHTGSVLTSEGHELATGRITLDTNHARPEDNALAAAEHYDRTGTATADVRAGEDAHGIWVAGALRPSTTAEQVREMRASPLSGDWRTVGGNLELVAALAVNVAGFPIPRPSGLVASGRTRSLVASGMVTPTPTPTLGLSDDDVSYLRRLADRERSTARAQVDQMASRLRARRAKALRGRVAHARRKESA